MLVRPSEEEVEERNNRSLKLQTASSIDRRGGEGAPHDVFTLHVVSEDLPKTIYVFG